MLRLDTDAARACPRHPTVHRQTPRQFQRYSAEAAAWSFIAPKAAASSWVTTALLAFPVSMGAMVDGAKFNFFAGPVTCFLVPIPRVLQNSNRIKCKAHLTPPSARRVRELSCSCSGGSGAGVMASLPAISDFSLDNFLDQVFQRWRRRQ